jgi:hypothetical protein
MLFPLRKSPSPVSGLMPISSGSGTMFCCRFRSRRSLWHVTVRYVTVGELRDDLPVEFLGEEADAVGVISQALASRAVALYPGHPGRVWRTQPQHVQVTWVGLEEEPASYAYGFDADSLLPSGRVIGLGHLAEVDFAQRETVMADVLAGGGNLTGWLPPWRGLPDASA